MLYTEAPFLKIVKKVSGLLVKLRYNHVCSEYKYFIRDTYTCRLYQLKYLIRDYILKKPYKIIEYKGEFAAEIQFCLPYAYWHYMNGTLKKTSSFAGTKELYFFSENHDEYLNVRSNEGNYNFDLPRIIYSHNYNMKKWLPVPLKKKYANEVYVFEKPLLIIANRFNSEWEGPPISYFSIEQLDLMISILKEKYTIIYNRPLANNIVNDNSTIFELDEFNWLKRNHPCVMLLNELYEANEIKVRNFNHFQLCVYANCSNFISIHGGTATLASYFGGKNLIFSKKGPEHYFKCYEKLYPKFSGTQIFHAKDDIELMKFVKEIF